MGGAEFDQCGVEVFDRTGFHWYRCGRYAKYRVTDGDTIAFVCGIHKKVWERRVAELGDDIKFPTWFVERRPI